MNAPLPQLRLGLIGDNIAASSSPRLHRLAGRQAGIEVSYDRLVPAQIGLGFEAILTGLPAQGYRGVNVTYPYKEVAAGLVRIPDPLVRAIGAVNTVIFGERGPQGHNTDHSGFVAAYRAARGDRAPGPVLMIGTGGVGRAVAFGLLALGAAEVRLVDRDRAKAEALAEALRAARPGVVVRCGLAETLAPGAEGLVNCTPVGMVGHPGTPLPAPLMQGAGWAFDAVYTPADTQFLTAAAAAGAAPISGWELFFWQGAHAWECFSGRAPDLHRLRTDLLEGLS